MNDSFWTGGLDAFIDGLNESYQRRLEELRKRREVADDTERDALEAEIERLEKEFESKLDSIDDCLF